ncbi:MAG: hypothetical protein OXF98_10435 [Rhodospirillaceae bacterium]|nr:hypothetical protein [Rhodospirillaceae bacterium]
MSVAETDRKIRWPGDPAGLTTEVVDFEALAHVLGNTCCWGGRTLKFYSLAQHAVTVCSAAQALGGLDETDGKSLALHALLADAWRAWLPEPAGGDGPAKALEKHARERDAVLRTVLEAAGAPAELPASWNQALELTRRMADAALVRDLAGAGVDLGASRGGPLFPPLKERIRPMRPEIAARRWLDALHAAAPPAADGSGLAQAPGGGT